MNERLKQIRKALGLTQQDFADRLGIKRGAIANYEIGRNEPIDAVLSLICREFGVNEEWLRSGEGEMFSPKASDALDALAKERRLSQREYIAIEKFLNLKPELRAGLIDYFCDVAAALNGSDASEDTLAQQGASIVEAEALYEKNLGFAPSGASTALNITGDTESTDEGKAADA